MQDTTDLEALAKRFLDLWQEQAASAASDPAVVAATQRFAELTAAAPSTWFALWTQALQAAQHAATHGRPAAGPDSPPPGAAAARPASGGGAVDLDELARRLATLERRVAGIESGQGGAAKRKRSARKPMAKPRRGRT